MRVLLRSVVAVVAVAGGASAQALPPVHEAGGAPMTEREAEPGSKWSFESYAYAYFVPEDENFVLPMVMADRDWLHLEARYNYEARDAGSLWAGYNLAVGEEVTLELTPMLGAVFGEAAGVAIGYRGALGWSGFELASEGEWLIGTRDSSDSFLYSWSELTWSPIDWLRFGISVQRTRAYQTGLDVQRGFVLGVTAAALDLSVYVFNVDLDDPLVVFGVGLVF